MAARALEAAPQAPPDASATYTTSWVEAPSIEQDETRKAAQARESEVFMAGACKGKLESVDALRRPRPR